MGVNDCESCRAAEVVDLSVDVGMHMLSVWCGAARGLSICQTYCSYGLFAVKSRHVMMAGYVGARCMGQNRLMAPPKSHPRVIRLSHTSPCRKTVAEVPNLSSLLPFLILQRLNK